MVTISWLLKSGQSGQWCVARSIVSNGGGSFPDTLMSGFWSRASKERGWGPNATDCPWQCIPNGITCRGDASPLPRGDWVPALSCFQYPSSPEVGVRRGLVDGSWWMTRLWHAQAMCLDQTLFSSSFSSASSGSDPQK